MQCARCGTDKANAWHRHQERVWCWNCLMAKACPCWTDAERGTVERKPGQSRQMGLFGGTE